MKTRSNKLIRHGLMAVLLLLLAWPAQAFYNPSPGRWINRDPIGENGGLNLCAYVGNSPTSRFDVLGRFGISFDDVVFGAQYSGTMLNGTVHGLTEVSLEIDDLRTKTSACHCRLLGLDLRLRIKVIVKAPGDRFDIAYGIYHGTVNDQGSGATLKHELVHVETLMRVIGTLFPKLEGDCAGKCMDSWFFDWSPGKCQQAWKARILSEMKWAKAKHDEIAELWDSWERYRPINAELEPNQTERLRNAMESRLAEWIRHVFCVRGLH